MVVWADVGLVVSSNSFCACSLDVDRMSESLTLIIGEPFHCAKAQRLDDVIEAEIQTLHPFPS